MRSLVLALALTPALLCAQDGPPAPATVETVWEVRYRGKAIGTETVSARAKAKGRVLTSKGNVKLPTAPRFEYEQTIEHDGEGFLRYELTSSMIVAKAERTADGAQVTRVYLGNTGQRAVGRGKGPYLCLDNLVWCHYDLLGAEAVARKHEPFEAVFLVPQGQAGIPARFEPGEPSSATVGEAKRTVRTGRLALAGVLVELTYDVESGAAYRVAIPSQTFEATVRGFVPAGSGDAAAEEVRWREQEVSVPAPLGPLPGTLCLPLESTPGPYPTLILLHGSGPNDRDETIGPNKPFRDLAHGLAARGIASLRYDKRTYLLQKQFFAGGDEARKAAKVLETLTLAGESIDDGVAALAWLAKREDVGPRFVLGHSLGALAAPEVAAQVDGLRGIVLMAGPGRGLDVIVSEQLVYKQVLAGMSEEEAKAKVEAGIGQQWKQLKEGKLPDMHRIMGATVFYWKDILSRSEPGKVLAQSKQPVLLLHGSKDYQVTRADYDALRAALESREGVPHESRWFEGLNHLFMPVQGKSTGAEYMIEGRMADDVIELIATWTLSKSKKD